MSYQVPIGVSVKHLHLSQTDLEALFGVGYQLQVRAPITQPNQFAAQETVTLITSKNKLERVRILGPVREQTQVELALTDAMKLGFTPPYRNSGDLVGSAAIKIVGSVGEITIPEGVIIMNRHLHLSATQAQEAGRVDGEMVRVRIDGHRALVLENVLIRAGDGNERELHLDTDEANAAGIVTGALATIIS